MKRSPTAIVMLILLALSPALSSHTFKQGNWVKLGDRTVNYTVDRSEIVLQQLSTSPSALRVKVIKGAINLHRCVVYFNDNQTLQLDVLNSVPAGSESKILELPAPAKAITKLVFTYDMKNRASQQVAVEVWARE